MFPGQPEARAVLVLIQLLHLEAQEHLKTTVAAIVADKAEPDTPAVVNQADLERLLSSNDSCRFLPNTVLSISNRSPVSLMSVPLPIPFLLAPGACGRMCK